MKQKTRKAAAKRVKVSGSGKLMTQKAAHGHRLISKSKGQKGKHAHDIVLASGDAKMLRRAIPGL